MLVKCQQLGQIIRLISTTSAYNKKVDGILKNYFSERYNYSNVQISNMFI